MAATMWKLDSSSHCGLTSLLGNYSIVNGFDVHGRPIVWLRPSRENTSPSPAQIRHLVFQLERALDLLPPGATTLALVVDYHGATRGSTPPLDICKSVIHILQNHYCERLGRAAVVNVPTLLQGFFAVVKPLLDPNTREKIAFNPPMQDVVPKQQLDPEFGGELEYEFDKDVYLPALCRICGVKEDGSRTEGSGEEAIPSAQATSAEGREEQSIPASTSNAPEPSAASDQTPQAVPPQATGDTNAVPAASLGGAAVAGASGAALASTSTSATPRAANGGESSAPPGKPRKGANLFSSKRGLDKAGNATIHRHKHLIKAFCMHKGAVEPGSAINADEEKAVPAGIVNEESKAQNGQETLVDDRAAILARRDERRVDEAPETEIVHSERPHPTQVHSMSQSDDAQLVSRPQVLQERLHSGGSDDLTLAFKVKQAPEGEMLD